MRRAWLAAGALLGLTGSVGAQPTTSSSGRQPGGADRTTVFDAVSGAEQVDGVTQAEEVALKLDRYERMTVPVLVAGSGPFRFLVDTGSERTVISRQLAERLRLPARPSARLHSVVGTSVVATAAVPPLQFSNGQVSVADAPLLDAAHMGADGILGVDSLRSQRVVFDFKALSMHIVPSRSRLGRDERGTIVVTARRRNGRLIVTDARANGRRVDVVVDTGAQISVGNPALKRALLSRRALQHHGTTEVMAVTGEKFVGDYMILKELEVGGVSLHGLAIIFADSQVFGQLGLHDRPALLLGMNAMRGFEKVSIDFDRKQVRVVLPERSSLHSRAFAQR